MSCSYRQGLVLCLLACSLALTTATQASERETHSVELTFYQLSSSEWNNALSSFKAAVAAEAATYCSNNAATCGLTSGFLFTATEVGISSGPTENSKSLKIKFYIDFPTVKVVSSPAITTHVVNSAAVTTIITNIRNGVENVVGADITYIEKEFYSISPASTLNKVLIPLAFILLLAIIILAIALHVWNQRKEQEAKKKQKALEREKRKKTSRITPVYTQETEVQKAKTSWLRLSRRKKVVMRMSNGNNGNIPTLSMKTNMLTLPPKEGGASADGVSPPDYPEPVPLKTNALPPLQDPEEETKEKTKEKKKQRKKEKRQRSASKKEGGGGGEEESEAEHSKTESLDKAAGKNIVAVEDELA